MRKNFRTLFIVFFVCLLSTHAMAWKCPQNIDDETRFKQADAVFLGRSKYKTELAHSMLLDYFTPINPQYDIKKMSPDAIKLLADPKTGNLKDEILIMQPFGSEGTFSFQRDTSYRIYARVAYTKNKEPYLTTDTCSGNFELKPKNAITEDSILPLARKKLFELVPSQNPDVQLKAAEHSVPGLTSNTGLQLFKIEKQISGSPASMWEIIYLKGKIFTFVNSFGGDGLMSALYSKKDSTLFYTYSFGSGRHRSHVGMLTFSKIPDKFLVCESKPFFDKDVFVEKTKEEKIYIEEGKYKEFNAWEFEATNDFQISDIDRKQCKFLE